MRKNTFWLSLAGAAGLAIALLGSPLQAQLSPAELKAQRARAAQAAAARAAAERQRAAAAVRASETARARNAEAAKQRAIRAETQRREMARRDALLAGARQQAVTEGKISPGYMTGRWAYRDPTNCETDDFDFGFHFESNGEWSAYEADGRWVVTNGILTMRYPQYDGDGDPYGNNKLIGYRDENSVPLKIAENVLIVEENGGSEAYFRCADNGARISLVGIPRRVDRETSYKNYDYGDAWGDAIKIRTLWQQGNRQAAAEAIGRYKATFPELTYNDSELLNYLGLYEWRDKKQLKNAAAWFLKNYQFDPGGDRAADSLLSLAEVMQQLGDNKHYCLALSQLQNDYTFDVAFRLQPRLAIVSKLGACG